jgi:hypothetical protein
MTMYLTFTYTRRTTKLAGGTETCTSRVGQEPASKVGAYKQTLALAVLSRITRSMFVTCFFHVKNGQAGIK